MQEPGDSSRLANGHTGGGRWQGHDLSTSRTLVLDQGRHVTESRDLLQGQKDAKISEETSAAINRRTCLLSFLASSWALGVES